MAFSAVGSPIPCSGTTFTISPQAVGDLVLMEITIFTSTSFAVGISGGGCTWQQITDITSISAGYSSTVFAGRVTSTGTNLTATVTFQGAATLNIRGSGQEFRTTLGGWALDQRAALNGANTNTFPSLTPQGAGELYFSYALNNSSPIAGSTPGYVYGQDSHGNTWLYNANCTSAAQAPVTGDSGNFAGIAVLVRETAYVSPFAPVGSWQFIETATGDTTLNTYNVGDIMPVIVLTAPSTVWCTGISGGGCTWQPVGSVVRGVNNDWAAAVFLGTVTSVGNNTCTLTYNGTYAAEHSRFWEIAVQGVTPSVDAVGSIDTTGTANWPSISSSDVGLYYGYAIDGTGAVPGTTPGFVWQIDGDSNGIAINASSAAGAEQAVWGDSAQQFGIALRIGPSVHDSGATISATAGMTASPASHGSTAANFAITAGMSAPAAVTHGAGAAFSAIASISVAAHVEDIRIPIVFNTSVSVRDLLSATVSVSANTYDGVVSVVTVDGEISVADPVSAALEEWSMNQADITLNESNDETVSLTISSGGSPVNLTGYTLNMLLKPQRGSSDGASGVLELTSPSGGITITNAAAGQALAAIAGTSITPNVWSFYRVDVIDSSSKRNTAVYGNVTINQL
jgi:hypothetical protein